jgi:plastocyanin
MMHSPKYMDKFIRILFGMFVLVGVVMTLPFVMNVLTEVIKVKAQSSDMNTSNVYETKSMDLGNNVKNLVILIPNEGHESQNIGDQSTDQRLVNQPYIPQSVTVPVGTAIMWFNGDVDHDHKITLVKQVGNLNNMIFDSGYFAYNTASQPVVMNNTGSFDYYQADVNNEDTDFVMNGTINVVGKSDNPNTTTTGISTDQPNANMNTVGTLMVPTGDLPTYTSDLENGGFSILSTYNFNDIRSGDPQTLIIWGTSSSSTNSGKCCFPTRADNPYSAI